MNTTIASPPKPRVTAVVVTFNRLRELKVCLNLLARQTYPPARVTVVDNQSTDGTAAWLETQPGLEIIHREHGQRRRISRRPPGISRRQFGLRLAVG